MKILHNHQKNQSLGMTLVELSVVIFVMLGLISVTFLGASAWKRHADRTTAILLIRNTQMGVRSHTRLEGLTDTTIVSDLPEQIFGENKYVPNGTDRSTGIQKPDGEFPDHPRSSENFGFVAADGTIIPALGVLYICTGGSGGVADPTYNPIPAQYDQW